MPERVTGEEGDSGCCDNLTPETAELSAPRSDAKMARNLELQGYYREPEVTATIFPCMPVLKWISDQKFIIAVILIVVLFIVIISLAVKKPETYPPCPSLASQGVACPDFWIGYMGKCFYVSKEESDWSLSLSTCSSFNASLAVIDSQKELDFWLNLLSPIHYWFGLSKEVNVWKWSNGTEFKAQFPVRGEGFCAYVNGKGASSTQCSMEKHFLCSRPESCSKVG